MCEKRYRHKAGLDEHVKTVHKNPLGKLVTCKICSQVFAKAWNAHIPFLSFLLRFFLQQSNLNRHIRMQHPIGVTKAVLDCPECSCVFANNRTLTRHRREAHGSGKTAVDAIALILNEIARAYILPVKSANDFLLFRYISIILLYCLQSKFSKNVAFTTSQPHT